jgi:hypothetical protein
MHLSLTTFISTIILTWMDLTNILGKPWGVQIVLENMRAGGYETAVL